MSRCIDVLMHPRFGALMSWMYRFGRLTAAASNLRPRRRHLLRGILLCPLSALRARSPRSR
eukprot:3625866-Lingulodinium_polyedra.AAC.1